MYLHHKENVMYSCKPPTFPEFPFFEHKINPHHPSGISRSIIETPPYIVPCGKYSFGKKVMVAISYSMFFTLVFVSKVLFEKRKFISLKSDSNTSLQATIFSTYERLLGRDERSFEQLD